MSSSPSLPPYPGAPWGARGLPIPSTGPYVLVTDRTEIHRWHGGIVALHATLAAVIVAAMVILSRFVDRSSLGSVALLPFLILLIGQMMQLSVHSYLWGARAAISRPAELDAYGVTFNLATGHLRIPWEAVQRVDVQSSLFAKVLVFRLHPGLKPGMPGVAFDVTPRQLARMQRLGILLGLRGLRQTPDQVRASITAASGGRFQF